MGFPRRVLEEKVANEIDRGESAVNQLKNILDPNHTNGILKFANSLDAAELDRMDLTPEQRAYIVAVKPKFQAIFDAITAQGF